MKKIIFSALILTFLVISNARSVSACTCLLIVGDDKRQVKKAYQNSSAVFAGEAIEIIKESEDYVKVKFKVERTWNDKFENEITLKVSQNESGCAYYPFKLGEKYLVYSSEYKNELYLPACSRTSALKSNKDIAFLNKIKKPNTLQSDLNK